MKFKDKWEEARNESKGEKVQNMTLVCLITY